MLTNVSGSECTVLNLVGMYILYPTTPLSKLLYPGFCRRSSSVCRHAESQSQSSINNPTHRQYHIQRRNPSETKWRSINHSKIRKTSHLSEFLISPPIKPEDSSTHAPRRYLGISLDGQYPTLLLIRINTPPPLLSYHYGDQTGNIPKDRDNPWLPEALRRFSPVEFSFFLGEVPTEDVRCPSGIRF